jgi:dihydrofolate reductase
MAGEKKVHIMGGASVIQQALQAGLVDSIRLHMAPIVLGSGIRLFDNSSTRSGWNVPRWWSRGLAPI